MLMNNDQISRESPRLRAQMSFSLLWMPILMTVLTTLLTQESIPVGCIPTVP